MQHLILIGALLLSTMTAASSCEGSSATTQEAVSQITSEIVVGMTREQVEDTLSRLGVTHTYVPREYLKTIGQDMFEGMPLSGRFDVLTEFETKVGRKSEAAIHIELDTQERVTNVRVEGFGLR